MKTYINLHNHTHGSLLDGLSMPKIYIPRAMELGMPLVTATEHGNLFSLPSMKKVADELGVKYMPGEEFYHARKTRHDQDDDERSGRARSEWDQRGPYHLTVLAHSNAGYKNIIKLSSRAYLEGYFGKPRIDRELMADHAEGLIALSGCLSGEVQQALLRDDFDYALKVVGEMQDILGKGNYFIEIMDHGIDEEKKVHAGLIELSRRTGAPIVATCDSHYTHREDAQTHDISLCISTGATIEQENRFRFYGDNFYLKSYEEMAAIFPEEWLDNTMLIYDKYDLDIQYGGNHYPVFDIPNGMNEDDYLEMQSYAGAERRFGPEWQSNKVVKDRLDHELNVIKQLGFANYFLIVSDIISEAKNRGILMGAGRGSAAGCLVSYCVDITEVDPIKYDLTFDRFLVYQPPEYEPQFAEVT